MIKICKKVCLHGYYICKTEQDPNRYEGSGTEWRSHLKKSPPCIKDHTTEILFSSADKEEVAEFLVEYDTINPEYWKDSLCFNMIREGGGYTMAGQANPNWRHGDAEGWKDNPVIQKANDKKRNAKYHEENSEIEKARMSCKYHAEKGHKKESSDFFKIWNPTYISWEEYYEKYSPTGVFG